MNPKDIKDAVADAIVCGDRELERHLDAALVAARATERARCRVTLAAVPIAAVADVARQAALAALGVGLEERACTAIGVAVLQYALAVLADATDVKPS